jgi:glucose/arabinose dehydrogenase
MGMAVAITTALAVTTAGWTTALASTDHASEAGPTAIVADPVNTELANPAGFAFLPNGKIVFGERRSGRVMLLNPDTGKTKVMDTISDVRSQGEQGLLGIAIDPKWPKKKFVYAYATRQAGSLQNQIVRIKMKKNKGVKQKVLWTLDTTAGTYHDGGHMDFGPDGKLYVGVGEGHDSSNAQDLSTDAGKMLRMTRKGKAPKDNPFEGSRVFTYGLRNTFGFAFDPQSGLLWQTENGPECVDELNVERAGENHAWGPHETCAGTPPENTNQDGPEPRIMPVAWFTPTIAPTGLAFCEDCGIAAADGAFFFGANNTGEIRQVNLTAGRDQVASMTIALDITGAVYSMQTAPDGVVYFSTPSGIYRLVEG